MIFYSTKTNTRGFTLIELLVVISIIGLLSSVVLASLRTARAKGRDAQRILMARELSTANELRYSNVGTYATTRGTLNNSAAVTALAADLTPYIKTVNITASEYTRYVYVVKDWTGCPGLDSGVYPPNPGKFAFYLVLENPVTTSANYVSPTVGDTFDQCMAVNYGVNYRVGSPAGPGTTYIAPSPSSSP